MHQHRVDYMGTSIIRNSKDLTYQECYYVHSLLCNFVSSKLACQPNSNAVLAEIELPPKFCTFFSSPDWKSPSGKTG